MANNIFGEPLISCSNSPVTGFFRSGCCETDEMDHGTHTVCAIMTEEFLQFTQSEGNDLCTPRPEYDFPGLKPGDRWCLCVTRWIQALRADVAPPIIPDATHEKTLSYIDLSVLVKNAYTDHS